MAARKALKETVSRTIAEVNVLQPSVSATTSGNQPKQQNADDGSPKLSEKYLELKDIPGPWPSIPILGTNWQYMKGGRYHMINVYESNKDKYRRYGPIVKEEFQWGRPAVQLYNPEDFQKVFVKQGRYPERRISDFLVHYRRNRPEKYESAGLANTLGDEWDRLRKVIAPVLLKPKAINFLMPSMNAVGDDFAYLLRAKRDPDTLVLADIKDAAYRLALEGVYMMSLDTRLGCLEPDVQENSTASDMILSVKLLFESFHELFYGLPLWKLYETASYKKLDRAESLMYEASSKQIEDTIEMMKNDLDQEEGVLRTLIKKDELSHKELVVSVIDLLSGGIFTVANSFSFLVYHMARNPDVQEKLYKELTGAMGDSEITVERMSKMPYLKACVKEAFRLSPTIPCINRNLDKDTILSGYRVPAGTEVFCNFPVPCMQEDKFPEPERFFPDRWLVKDRGTPSWNPFSLLPFGFGQRMCIGKRFAEMELHVALAKLVYNFQLEYVGQELEVKAAFIIVPSNPISVVLRDR